jgi:hypothetical protein
MIKLVLNRLNAINFDKTHLILIKRIEYFFNAKTAQKKRKKTQD